MENENFPSYYTLLFNGITDAIEALDRQNIVLARDILVRRLSQGQIGAVSAPICAICRRSLGGSSIVSVQSCPIFSCSGSKLGQV